MIPQFPHFKKIGLNDRELIETHTNHQRPYSTFNFTNFWSWDVRDERMVSKLNGNLIFYFTDYRTSEPFLSFHGANKPVDTVIDLLHFTSEHNGSPVLRFIPEETVHHLRTTNLYIEEDRGNFDYIFSTSKLAALAGSAFKTKRMLSRKFQREYPEAIFELHDLTNRGIQKQILSVVRKWEYNKKINSKPCDLEHEEVALNRLLKTAHAHDTLLSTVSIQGNVIGFSIDEILPHQFAMAHFIKGDNSFKGIYEFLNEKTAQYLLDHDVIYWNWQQDLNMPGLRKLKESYKPIDFFKKYRVALSVRERKNEQLTRDFLLQTTTH